jgi:apolipoprotein N-acyltransferase
VRTYLKREERKKKISWTPSLRITPESSLPIAPHHFPPAKEL